MIEPSRPEVVMRSPEQSPAVERQMARAEDVRLVALALQGQDDAYEVLVHRYTPMVIGFLYSRTGHSSDTEDIAQDTFFAAYRHLGRLRNPEAFGAWLMTIARAKLIDHCRKQSRQPAILEPDPNMEDIPDPLDMAPSPAVDPSRMAFLSQAKSIVLRELDALNEKYRCILYWRLLGDESAQEIAERLNLRENTVRMRLFRGLKLLRKALKRHGITSFPER